MNITDSDIGDIIKVIKNNHSYDFNDIIKSFFIRRIRKVIDKQEIGSFDELFRRLKKDKNFIEHLIQVLNIEVTEAFRDPTLWKLVRDELLPELIAGKTEKVKIWFPNVTTGEELYSMAILLKESKLAKKVVVTASSLSIRSIDQIKTGFFDKKKMKLNEDNYAKFEGTGKLPEYCTENNNKIRWDTLLIKNVSFLQGHSILNMTPKDVDMIIYRNHMIYYNQNFKNKIINILNHSLVKGGYLIIGTKENLEEYINKDRFEKVNYDDKVYRKLH